MLQILTLLFLVTPAITRARADSDLPKERGQSRKTASQKRRKDKSFRPRSRFPGTIGKQSGEQVALQFTLDWTNHQIHRVNDGQPIEIILNGTIESNSSEIWTLFPVQPKPEITPDLHYVEDVQLETGSGTERKTPLEWTISLDKGMPEPMTILPDNSITYTFPEGRHSFQVRITGKVERDQPAGYYRLQLAQSLVPQL
jgi:hypothetical protein